MRKLAAFFILAVVAAGVVGGCSSVDDKPAVTVTDNEGIVEPRVVTVGYVNERLDRMPTDMIPDVSGDEGKREFIEEIIRKEILVIYGTRIGILEDERLPVALEHFEDSKAEEMLREELIVGPAQVTPEEVVDYYAVREDLFQLQEIWLPSHEDAMEVYERVTTGGEDFGRVASEVSRGPSAEDEGRRPVTSWADLHPLTRVAVRYLEKDDITEPFAIGETWYVVKVASRKDPADQKPLEGSHLNGITAEARNFNRNILEYQVFKGWQDAANPVFFDDAIDICGTRIDEARAIVLPEDEVAETMDERMEIARRAVIPEFTEEEAAMVLLTYNIDGEEHTITLGDFARMSSEVPGIETVKTGDRISIESFLKRTIQQQTIQKKIDDRGYRTSPEMQEFLALRTEEFIIDITYDQEVVQKVEEPEGQEIRDYYRSNLERFIEPDGVDVQQLIVSTEGQANLILQRVRSGEADFTDMVKTHSIDSWSKAKDGLIEKYRVGERRLDYLQGIAFDLEIGEISEPVRAPGGYALVKVLAKYPERQMPFSEVAQVVRQSVIATKREALLTQLLEDARNSVTIEFADGNLQYVNDPSEVLAAKLGEGTQDITIPLN